MPLEDIGHEIEQTALFAVDLQFEAVLAHEGDLHPRKEGGEKQHRDDQNDGYGHGAGAVWGSDGDDSSVAAGFDASSASSGSSSS